MMHSLQVTIVLMLMVGYYFVLKEYLKYHETRYFFMAYTFLTLGVLVGITGDSMLIRYTSHTCSILIAGVFFGIAAYKKNKRIDGILRMVNGVAP